MAKVDIRGQMGTHVRMPLNVLEEIVVADSAYTGALLKTRVKIHYMCYNNVEMLCIFVQLYTAHIGRTARAWRL